jgi:hypothetical protein
MKKQLLEDIRRIKSLMSLIVEDVNAECIEGNCLDGRGTLKIPALYDDNVFDFETTSEKIIKGNFKDNKPINGEDYLVTFKTYFGTATYDGQMNDAFGMYGYGKIQLPNQDNPDEEPYTEYVFAGDGYGEMTVKDAKEKNINIQGKRTYLKSSGTIYEGNFTQKSLGDEISLTTDRIIKDNIVVNQEKIEIDNLYDYNYQLPGRLKYQEDEKKKTSDAIQDKIKKQKEEELNKQNIIKKQKEDELNKQKEEAKQFSSLLPKYVVELQKFIDSKNCDSVYDKINTIINSGKVNTIDKWDEFMEQCRSLITVDQTTNTPKAVSYSKYPNGVVEEIKKNCSDYDWSFIDDYVNTL